MSLIEFVNPHPYSITLPGPDGNVVRVPRSARIVLPAWFSKYSPRFLREVRQIGKDQKPIDPHRPSRKKKSKLQKKSAVKIVKRKRAAGITPSKKSPVKSQKRRRKATQIQKRNKRANYVGRRRRGRPVGRAISGDATKLFRAEASGLTIPVSNNIGVGILSYNRLHCIRRCLDSIRKYTDLSKTTVFVSDESDNPEVKKYLREQKDIVLLDNSVRLGIAGQSNRLLNCLRRFKKKIILNDDVQILNRGWEHFYFDAMKATGYHHFCYRQAGVYGALANQASKTRRGNRVILTVGSKPHGAVMALDEECFQKVGYFDQQFGHYGMEHVDWSNRAGLSGLQPRGFHDILGADKFFRIYPEITSVSKIGLKDNRDIYNQFKDNRDRVHVEATPACDVPSLSVIIPCRAQDRDIRVIETVAMNMKAQLFPHIDLIIVEQDNIKKVRYDVVGPCTHKLIQGRTPDQPFTKALAFNLGAASAQTERLLLQDADIMMQNNYAAKIFRILGEHEGCHIGKYVLYFNHGTTHQIFNSGKVTNTNECERAVGYFEGGSLACRRGTYFKVGGFNDAFVGYGCEDCDFFLRLKDNCKFFNERTTSLFHLWHGRSPGWEQRHRLNKGIMERFYNRYNRNKTQALGELRGKLRAKYPNAARKYL